MNFEDMRSTAGNDDENYDYDDFATVEWPGTKTDPETKTVVGELLQMDEDVGKYDSTVYLIEDEDGEKVLVWGNGSIDAAVSNAEDLSVGDTIGIRQTGDTYTNDYGTFPQFDVRYQNAE